MAVVMTPPTNFPRRINMYVPAMQYASDVNMYSATRVSFLAPAAPVTNNILNAQSIATASTVDLTANANAQNILDPFGRTIQFSGGAGTVISTTTSAASAAGVNTITVTSPTGILVGQPVTNTTAPASIINGTTVTAINGSVITLSNAVVAPGVGSGNTVNFAVGGAVVVRGSDYLGQPVTANVNMSGATVVETRKAFKYVDSVSLPGVAGATINMGWGTSLGLPYKALRIVAEVANGINVVAGTFIPPSLNDPQTAGTADPRGIYKPTTTLNGANIISGVFDMVNDINSNNNGGLHGVRAA